MINELKALIIKRLQSIHNESLLALANHPSIKEKAYGNKVYGAEYKGQNANIIFLLDTNDDFVNAIEELKAEGKIEIRPLDFLSSISDGNVYDLPIAKHVKVYVEPHWMPVELILKHK